MQRLFIAIVISSCTVLPAAAQSFSYYPADADHVFLWGQESPEALLIKRVGGKWKLDGTPLRKGTWPELLARTVTSKDQQDKSSAALDDMVAGVANKSVAVLRRPNAHALFIKRGDARLLLSVSSSTASSGAAFDKKGDTGRGQGSEPTWTKGVDVPLGIWLGTKDEIEAGKELREIFKSAPVPDGKNWPRFWEAIAKEAVSSTDYYHASSYGHAPASAWLLVEFSNSATTVVDRVHHYTPPVHRVVMHVKDASPQPLNGTPLTSTLLALAGTAGLGILAGLAIPLVLPWLLWHEKPSFQRLFGKGRNTAGDNHNDDLLLDSKNVDKDVEQFIEELRPAIGAALANRVSASAQAKDKNARAELEATLQVISAAAAECSQSSPQYFGDLALERPRDATWSARFAERLRKCVQSAQQALDTSATNLKTANAERVNTDQENEKLEKERNEAVKRNDQLKAKVASAEALERVVATVTKERDEAVKRNDQLKAKVASAEALERVVATVTKERDDLQKSMEKERARADSLGKDSDKRQKQFEVDRASWVNERTEWDTRIRDSRKDLDRIQQSLGPLGRLSELLQNGLMNHYSRDDDGPAAAMLGFLANHSLTQLSFAIAADREPQQRYMLLNLETICRSFPDLRGYKNAKAEIEQHFGSQRPPAEAEIQRASLRAEASIFQFTLRYLQKTSRDLNAYYFFVDDNGLPYRAQA
jgi:hypothetical protein